MWDIVVYVIAGLGAGVGTGFAGLSAAAVIAPMLVTFCGMDAYQAVTISLAADVLASAVSTIEYGKNKNLDIKNGLVMLFTILLFTMLGSYVASLIHDSLLGNFSIFMTLILGIKFIVWPVMTTKDKLAHKKTSVRIIQSIISGIVIGFICGFIGAGGGMMMLLILTMVLGYELKTAVGTSVFIMTFTALTGAASHVVIGGFPDLTALLVCIGATLVGALLSSLIANKVSPKTLNRVTGIILTMLGVVMIVVNFLPQG